LLALLVAFCLSLLLFAQGQWIDPTEQVNLNELFERMTAEETGHVRKTHWKMRNVLWRTEFELQD
jgi:lipopolysaccharide export LptBFGC system permease protein LptF